jgi:hypothetical protein
LSKKRPVVTKKRYSKKISNTNNWSFNNLLLQHSYVNTDISPALTKALADYTGPTVIVSSAKRFGSRSKHCTGNAIDISKESIETLIPWLESEEGAKWIETYNLTIYIENVNRYKKHK